MVVAGVTPEHSSVRSLCQRRTKDENRFLLNLNFKGTVYWHIPELLTRLVRPTLGADSHSFQGSVAVCGWRLSVDNWANNVHNKLTIRAANRAQRKHLEKQNKCLKRESV